MSMAIENFPMWHASLRHPAGNIPLHEGEPCMYTYVCEIFVCFRTYLFVRALLAKTPKLRRHRKAVRNLSSRFELDPSTICSSRGERSKFFFWGEWVRRFPGVSVQRIFIFIAHTVFCFFCGEIMTQRKTATQRQATAAVYCSARVYKHGDSLKRVLLPCDSVEKKS